MTQANPSARLALELPRDNLARGVAIANPETSLAKRVAVGSAGDTYTIVVGGHETEGRYCLIDMHVPDGSGPPPHRHDFDESFTVLEGEVEFFVRGEVYIVAVGSTVTVPANAPHFFKNVSGRAARMLCFCAPSGLDEFFLAIGTPVDSRTAAQRKQTADELKEDMLRIGALAAKCRMEIFAPD